jgi:hypothetical protein
LSTTASHSRLWPSISHLCLSAPPLRLGLPVGFSDKVVSPPPPCPYHSRCRPQPPARLHRACATVATDPNHLTPRAVTPSTTVARPPLSMCQVCHTPPRRLSLDRLKSCPLARDPLILLQHARHPFPLSTFFVRSSAPESTTPRQNQPRCRHLPYLR